MAAVKNSKWRPGGTRYETHLLVDVYWCRTNADGPLNERAYADSFREGHKWRNGARIRSKST